MNNSIVEQPKMTVRAIIPLLILSFGLTWGMTACGTNANIDTNADKVASAATEIADFDLPAGYSPEFSAQLEGYTLVFYDQNDGYSHLVLIQSEKDADSKHLASMAGQIAPGSYDPQTQMTIIGTLPSIVREQEVTIYISEGVTPEGETYRQMTLAFQGNGGPALVMLTEPVDKWNQDMVDAFVASIH